MGDSRAYLYRKGRLTQLTTGSHRRPEDGSSRDAERPTRRSIHPNAAILPTGRLVASPALWWISVSHGSSKRVRHSCCARTGFPAMFTDAEIRLCPAQSRPRPGSSRTRDKLPRKRAGRTMSLCRLFQYGRRRETHLVHEDSSSVLPLVAARTRSGTR